MTRKKSSTGHLPPQEYDRRDTEKSWREGFDLLTRHVTTWSLVSAQGPEEVTPPYADELLDAALTQRDQRAVLGRWLEDARALSLQHLDGEEGSLVNVARQVMQSDALPGSAQWLAAEVALGIEHLNQAISDPSAEPHAVAYLAVFVEWKAQSLRMLVQPNHFDTKSPKRTPVEAADAAAVRYVSDSQRSRRDEHHEMIDAQMHDLVLNKKKTIASAASIVARKWPARSAEALEKRYRRDHPSRKK